MSEISRLKDELVGAYEKIDDLEFRIEEIDSVHGVSTLCFLYLVNFCLKIKWYILHSARVKNYIVTGIYIDILL